MGLPGVGHEWHGDNPFFLLLNVNGVAIIDLDEPKWMEKFAHLIRREGEWHLVRKAGGVVALSMRVLDGEQPYYTARHIGVGVVGRDGVKQNEVIAYGIGKKRRDYETKVLPAKNGKPRRVLKIYHWDRLWVFPTGQVCGGDDAEYFGRLTLARWAAEQREAEEKAKEAANGKEDGDQGGDQDAGQEDQPALPS